MKVKRIIAILLIVPFAFALFAAENPSPSTIVVKGVVEAAGLETGDDKPLIDSNGLTVIARIYESDSTLSSYGDNYWASATPLMGVNVSYTGVRLDDDIEGDGLRSFALIYAAGGNTATQQSGTVELSSVSWKREGAPATEAASVEFGIATNAISRGENAMWYAVKTDEAVSNDHLVTVYGTGVQSEFVPVAYSIVTWNIADGVVPQAGTYVGEIMLTVTGS